MRNSRNPYREEFLYVWIEYLGVKFPARIHWHKSGGCSTTSWAGRWLDAHGFPDIWPKGDVPTVSMEAAEILAGARGTFSTAKGYVREHLERT